MNDSSENYWLRLLLREWAQFCIFVYIGYAYPFSSASTLEFSNFIKIYPKKSHAVWFYSKFKIIFLFFNNY